MIENVINEITEKTIEIEENLKALRNGLIKDNVSQKTLALYEKAIQTFLYNKGVTETFCKKIMKIYYGLIGWLDFLDFETNQNE